MRGLTLGMNLAKKKVGDGGGSPPVETYFLLLSGDMQSGTDRLLLSGDMQDGTDKLVLSGDMKLPA